MASSIPIPTVPWFQDLRGKRFGRLVVQEYAGKRKRYTMWRCRCDCGTCVDVHAGALKAGNTKSCGCYAKEVSSFNGRNRSNAHGYARHGHKTSTYRSWLAARERCRNPKSKDYARYGGRGIKFALVWDDFMQFLADMGERPEGTTLDRIDNNGDYKPGNCRWATPIQQMNGRSSTRHYIELNWQKMTISEAAALVGKSYIIVARRLGRGWSAERALFAPSRRK